MILLFQGGAALNKWLKEYKEYKATTTPIWDYSNPDRPILLDWPVEECKSNMDCQDGEVCMNGECVKVEPSAGFAYRVSRFEIKAEKSLNTHWPILEPTDWTGFR